MDGVKQGVTILDVCSPNCGDRWKELTKTAGRQLGETTSAEVIFQVHVTVEDVVAAAANAVPANVDAARHWVVWQLKGRFKKAWAFFDKIAVLDRESLLIWPALRDASPAPSATPSASPSTSPSAKPSTSPSASPTQSPTQSPTTTALASPEARAAATALGAATMAICVSVGLAGVLGYFARAAIASAARAGAKKARALLRAADPAIALFVTFLQSAGALGALKKNALI